MAVNMVVLMGRLVRDPEVRYIQSGNGSVARFTIAVERDYKAQGEEKPKTNFISCVAWNKTAEFIEKYFRQGNMIAVTGEIETDSYTDREGKKVYTTDVRVNKVSFTGEKRGDATEGRPAPSATDSDGFMNIPDGIDEELPFN